MTLPPEEIARRLRAARTLRGVDQRNLNDNDALADNGLGWTTIGRIERLERQARPMELRAIAEALDVPYRWFTDEDPFAAGPVSDDLLRDVGGKLDELLRIAHRVDEGKLEELLRIAHRVDDVLLDGALEDYADGRAAAALSEPAGPASDEEDAAADRVGRRAQAWRAGDERAARGPRGLDADEEASSD